ncbi:unnamed protein product, partial [Amoebophrya sp. A25]
LTSSSGVSTTNFPFYPTVKDRIVSASSSMTISTSTPPTAKFEFPIPLSDILQQGQEVPKSVQLRQSQWSICRRQNYMQQHADGSGQLVDYSGFVSHAQTLTSSYKRSWRMHSQFVVENGRYFRKTREDIISRKDVGCEASTSSEGHDKLWLDPRSEEAEAFRKDKLEIQPEQDSSSSSSGIRFFT